MINRAFAGGLAATIVLSGLFVPAQTAARGGMVSAGHHGSFLPGAVMHRSPRAMHVPTHHHRVVASTSGARFHIHNSMARHHHRVRDFGFPRTWAGGSMFYGSYYDPADVVGSIDVPPEAEAPNGPDVAVAPERRGCRLPRIVWPERSDGLRNRRRRGRCCR